MGRSKANAHPKLQPILAELERIGQTVLEITDSDLEMIEGYPTARPGFVALAHALHNVHDAAKRYRANLPNLRAHWADYRVKYRESVEASRQRHGPVAPETESLDDITRREGVARL